MSNTKPPKVVHSQSLADYDKLPIAQRNILERFDQMRDWCQAAGRTIPDSIRLYSHDYNIIDKIVQEQSRGVYNAGTATHRGVSLCKHNDPKKLFTLEPKS